MRQLKRMPLTVSNTIDAPAAAPAVLPRLRVGKLCIAVQGATPAELMSRVDAALKDSPFIEFRLDSLPKPAAVLPDIKSLLNRRRDMTAIATCRRKPFGGSSPGPSTRSSKSSLKPLKPAATSSISRSIRPSSVPVPSWPSSALPSVPPAPLYSSARTTSLAPAAPRASIKPLSASPPMSPTSSKSSPPPALWPTISPSSR